MTFRDWLESMSACGDAVEWVGDRDLETAWTECDRGDWMLWLAGRLKVDRRLLVRAACACARTALPHVQGDASRLAIETAESWCDGRATIEEVRKSAYAAAAAARSADAAYAAYAAAAATAYAAYAAAYAVATATAARDATGDATAAAYCASAYARDAAQKSMAGIVRSVISLDTVKAAYEEALR